MDSFNTFTSAAYIVLMLLSSLFYPLDGLPAWFRAAAFVNPMTWQADILRFTLFGAGSPSAFLLQLAAFAVFTVVSLSLAVRAIDRAG
jgi:ABC-2 type transport system permease protein